MRRLSTVRKKCLACINQNYTKMQFLHHIILKHEIYLQVLSNISIITRLSYMYVCLHLGQMIQFGRYQCFLVLHQNVAVFFVFRKSLFLFYYFGSICLQNFACLCFVCCSRISLQTNQQFRVLRYILVNRQQKVMAKYVKGNNGTPLATMLYK